MPSRLLDELGGTFQYAAAHLVQLYGFEQGFEIAFAKTVVALALDDFKENRTNLVFSENLQQQAALWRPIEQYLVLLQAVGVLAVVWQPAIQQFVISVGSIQELQAAAAQLFDGCVNILGRQGNVLYAFASVQVEVFLDLAFFFSAFLIDGN